MLRNRSRAVTTKQAIMGDQSSLSSPSQNHTRPISYFFSTPKFFNGFLGYEPEISVKSPTSILDSKPFSAISNPLDGYDKEKLSKSPTIFSGNKHSFENSDPKPKPKPIGLALVDSFTDDEKNENFTKPNSRMVLFGSKLKIQIPSLPIPSAHSVSESPKTPPDFGIKTRNSICLSPFGSGIQSNGSLSVSVSVSEMELSEDYTCVISHGPNPKTTHIYDNCVLESCCGAVMLSEVKSELFSSSSSSSYYESKSPSKNFLSFCYTCKKNLDQGKDIFIYRGEKAFCSQECRFQEMLLDSENNSEFGGCF